MNGADSIRADQIPLEGSPSTAGRGLDELLVGSHGNSGATEIANEADDLGPRFTDEDKLHRRRESDEAGNGEGGGRARALAAENGGGDGNPSLPWLGTGRRMVRGGKWGSGRFGSTEYTRLVGL
jgi:hypothetical protein